MKIVYILVALLALLPGGAGLQAVEAKLLLTLQTNVNDQWEHILPGRPPFISTVSQVVRGEPFRLYVVVKGCRIDNQRAKLSATFRALKPDGSVYHTSELPAAELAMSNPDAVFLLPSELRIAFDPPDPEGEYCFEVKVSDLNAGTAVEEKTAITLTSEAEMAKQPLTEIGKYLNFYYRNPQPNELPRQFPVVTRRLLEQQKKRPVGFSPWPQLAFFYFVLRDNPYLIESMRQLESGLSEEEKPFLRTLLYEYAQQDRSRLMVKTPKSPIELDILWSQFAARGNSEAIVKLVGAIPEMEGTISIEDFKKLKEKTPENQASLMRHLIGRAAFWSLNSQAKNHPLVGFYLEAMLARKEIKSPFAAALVAKILENPQGKKTED